MGVWADGRVGGSLVGGSLVGGSLVGGSLVGPATPQVQPTRKTLAPRFLNSSFPRLFDSSSLTFCPI